MLLRLSSFRVACAIFCLSLALCVSGPAAWAAPKAAPVPHSPILTTSQSKNVHVATFNSVDEQGVHATLRDGTILNAEIRPSSLFLINGQAASAADFKPGVTVLLRTRTRASDGVISVVMLCDGASAIAIEAYRKKPLVGKMVSTDEKTVVIQPDGLSATMVTLRVTPKTVYRKSGQEASASAFPPGSTVAIVTRGLPSGLLMASIVSDRSVDAISEKTALKPISIVGTAVAIDTDKSLLTLAPKTKPRQTIAIISTTSIKVGKLDATLADIAKGMRVSARLSRQKDSEGHLIAASLSAFPIAIKSIHKNAATRTP